MVRAFYSLFSLHRKCLKLTGEDEDERDSVHYGVALAILAKEREDEDDLLEGEGNGGGDHHEVGAAALNHEESHAVARHVNGAVSEEEERVEV